MPPATSSFPFTTQGPIDFSPLNFVRTEQIETLDASGTITSVEVRQSYDPIAALWTIMGLVVLFIAACFFVAKQIYKK
jgi:hypothetical protein